MKRIRARAKGRANRIIKRTSHISLTVARRVFLKRPAWGRKYIRPGSAWASSRTGPPSGMRIPGTTRDLLNKDMQVRGFLQEAPLAGLRQPHPDRAAGEERPDHHSHGPARHGHRQERRGHRALRKEVSQMMGVPGAHQHRGDPQARARRPAGGRERRPAARAPHHVPARHEAGGAEHHASGGRGRQDQHCGPSRTAPRSPAASGTGRAACRCTPCGPISTTASPRR